MPEEGPDYWFAVTVALLVVAWSLNVVVPVLIIRPVWQGMQQEAYLDEPTADLPVPDPPPGIWMPIVGAVAALGAIGISVRRMAEQKEMGGRWLWMAAVGGLAFVVTLGVMWMVMRATIKYAEMYLGAGG